MKNYIVIVFCFIGFAAFAQPYQKQVRDGNKAFQKGTFDEAEVNYKKATEANPEAFEGWFNLGDALYRQQRYDEALEAYTKGVQNTTSPKRAASAMHNIGNVFAGKKDFQKATEAYKQALRLNPEDQETRYNLAKAQRELKKQQQQQQNQDQNKDQDKDEKKEDQKDQENKDQKNDQNQDQDQKDKPEDQEESENKENDPMDESDQNDDAKKNEDQKSDEQENEKDQAQNRDKQQDENGKPDEAGGQPEPKKMSKEEMERLLEAIANAEKKTRAKLDKKKKAKAKTTSTEKDW